MPRIRLQHPIRTLDNRLLFPNDIFLTEEALKTVIHSGKDLSYPMDSLLSYGSIKEHCLHFSSDPPYETIFSGKIKLHGFLSILEAVRLPIPILQSLDYFKQHDFYTYAHTLMVFALSALLAEDLIPDRRDCIRLSSTGPTHDIGKICVPLPILKKATPLRFPWWKSADRRLKSTSKRLTVIWRS